MSIMPIRHCIRLQNFKQFNFSKVRNLELFFFKSNHLGLASHQMPCLGYWQNFFSFNLNIRSIWIFITHQIWFFLLGHSHPYNGNIWGIYMNVMGTIQINVRQTCHQNCMNPLIWSYLISVCFSYPRWIVLSILLGGTCHDSPSSCMLWSMCQ